MSILVTFEVVSKENFKDLKQSLEDKSFETQFEYNGLVYGLKENELIIYETSKLDALEILVNTAHKLNIKLHSYFAETFKPAMYVEECY